MSKNKVFVVGKIVREMQPQKNSLLDWELMGIFDNYDNALKICTSDCHFIGPVELNKHLRSENSDWDGLHYPKKYG